MQRLWTLRDLTMIGSPRDPLPFCLSAGAHDPYGFSLVLDRLEGQKRPLNTVFEALSSFFDLETESDRRLLLSKEDSSDSEGPHRCQKCGHLQLGDLKLDRVRQPGARFEGKRELTVGFHGPLEPLDPEK